MHGTVLITGGARGIGAATARLAAARGFAVAVHYRQQREAAEQVVAAIRAAGGQAATVQGEVAEEHAVARIFGEVDGLFPGRPLSGLVNSAGISIAGGPVAEFNATDLARLLAVNVLGTMLCCREAVRRMSLRRGGQGGAIVNISSMASTIGGRPGRSAYAASKAAVDVFTIGLAKEVAAEGIRVNAVRPGMTLTDMTGTLRDNPTALATLSATIPMNRVAAADEVAHPIVWLLTESEASFVAGCLLDVSGGGFVVSGSLSAHTPPAAAAQTAGRPTA